MLNLDLLGAISLDKGCYTGQEIIARTHYRGATRRRCLRFEADGPVRAGDKVLDGDREIGDVLNAIGRELLAVIPVDSAGKNLTAAGVGLRPVALPYLDAENTIGQSE
jgi:folate-binding Fe-S cluster repair protein YgfZ